MREPKIERFDPAAFELALQRFQNWVHRTTCPPAGFDRLWPRAQKLDIYNSVFGAWAGSLFEHATTKPAGSDEAHLEVILSLYRIGGDVAVGRGDESEGREIRKALIRLLRARDATQAKRFRDIDKNRKNVAGFGTTKEILLSLWMPCSLWLFSDADVNSILSYLDKSAGILRHFGGNVEIVTPSKEAIKRARQELRLFDWRASKDASTPPVTFDYHSGRITAAKWIG